MSEEIGICDYRIKFVSNFACSVLIHAFATVIGGSGVIWHQSFLLL